MVQNYNIIAKVRFPAAAAIHVPTTVDIASVAILHVHGFLNFVMFP